MDDKKEDTEGYAVIPSSRMSHQARTQPPLIGPKPPALVQQTESIEEYTVVSPGSMPVVSPAPLTVYNHTTHSPIAKNVQQQVLSQEYLKLNRSDNSLSSSTDTSLLPSTEYSVLDVPVVSPPPTGNPTQEAGYGHLSDTNTEQTEADYALVGDDNSRLASNSKPKVKARKAFQKAQNGQLQTTRERTDFTSYGEDLVQINNSKSPPPTKPARPPLTYQATDAPGMSQEPSKQEPTSRGNSLSNEELERAGYETVNTILDEPEDNATEEQPTIPMPRQVISPKVEIDIDLMNQIKTAIDGRDEPVDEEDTYGNQLIIEAVQPVSINNDVIDDSKKGLILSSPDMFTVPQHAVPGPLGYCVLDLNPSEHHQTYEDELINPGAGVVEGDRITVKHNSYPNAEGYCDIAMGSLPPQDSVSNKSIEELNDCDIKENSPKMASSDASLDVFQPQPQNDSVLKSPAHTYELVSLTHSTAPKNKLEDSIPPKPKRKPKRSQTESEEFSITTPKETKGSLSTAASVDASQKAIRRPRRAPPPPPTGASVDDNVLPSKRDTSPRVSGDIATLPRGQSLLKSPKTPSANQQQSKVKPPSGKSLPSPKTEGASPKIFKRFFNKMSSNSPESSKKNWRKKSLRLNKESPPLSPGRKVQTLPPTGRTHHDQPLPTLDSVNDWDDDDMYATIQETLLKSLPSPLASASPKPVSLYMYTIIIFNVCVYHQGGVCLDTSI